MTAKNLRSIEDRTTLPRTASLRHGSNGHKSYLGIIDRLPSRLRSWRWNIIDYRRQCCDGSNAPGECRNATMAYLAVANGHRHKKRWSFAIAVVSLSWTASLQIRAAAEDEFQDAVNYVFTGRIDPQDGPEIVDRNSCVVILSDPKNQRYVRYYLSRFRMDAVRISKTYSGRQTFYTLEVEGDDVVVENLAADKKAVVAGYRTAQISIPGDIDQTEKALHLIFTDHCKADKPKPPF
jgi:hypothetical protein